MARETSVTLRVKDGFSRQFHDFQAGLNKSTGVAKSFGTRAGEAFGLVARFAPLAGAAIAGFAIKAGMDMEQTRIAFKTLTGSTEEAQKHLDDLRAFAAKTPFQFTELTQASRRLMAFGFEAEKVIPMLRDIGDAVAAMGGSSDMIDRVTLAIGQMSAKGKVSAQEMLQLTEAGIPAWRFLAESIGVSTAEVQKMTEKGLIPANQAIDAILGGMRKDFGGMMAEQSKTAAGQLSNVVDLLVETATTLGEALLPAIKTVLQDGVLPFVQGLKTLIVGGEETNKELIKLSNSPYLLEKGFAKLALLMRAGGELTEVYNRHLEDMRERLLSGAETEISFTNELKRSRDEIVKGLVQMQLYGEAEAFLKSHTDDLIEAEAEHTFAMERARKESEKYAHGMTEADFAAQRLAESVTGTISPLDKMRDALRDVDVRMGMLKDIMAGAVGKELKDFKEAQEENRAKAAELRAELEKLEASHGRAVTATNKNKASSEELALWQFQLGEATQDMADAQDTSSEAYLRAAVKAQNLKEKIDGATGATTTFVDNSKRIGEVEGELSELDQAYADNAAAHKEATGRILFDIAAQQLAMDGLTTVEVAALRALAVEWGLMDEETANAMSGVLEATLQLAEDQSLPNFRKNMQETREEVLNFGADTEKSTRYALLMAQENLPDLSGEFGALDEAVRRTNGLLGETKDRINQIPTRVDITVAIHTEGAIPNIPAPGGAPIAMQHGGRTRRGETFLVGEREPEIFVPEQNGFIVNQQQAAAAAAGTFQIGPITIYNPAPGMDVAGLARDLEAELARRIRPLRQSGA